MVLLLCESYKGSRGKFHDYVVKLSKGVAAAFQSTALMFFGGVRFASLFERAALARAATRLALQPAGLIAAAVRGENGFFFRTVALDATARLCMCVHAYNCLSTNADGPAR